VVPAGFVLKLGGNLTLPVNLAGTTLYVAGGDLTVSEDVGTAITKLTVAGGNLKVDKELKATTLVVDGDVTAKALITGTITATGQAVEFLTTPQTALTGLIADSVTSSENISSSGNIAVEGELKTTGGATVTVTGTGTTLEAGSLDMDDALTVSAGAGAVTIEGNADIGGDFTAGGAVDIGGNANIDGAFSPTGAVEIGGNATIGGVFTAPTTATVTIDGDATFEADFTAKTGAVTIGGNFTPKGDVDVSAGVFTANGTVTIADQKTITIDITTIAGTGKIVALGTTSGGIMAGGTTYTTTSDGVLISKIKDAVTDLGTDTTALTGSVDLTTNFGGSITDAIGSVTLIAANDAVVINDTDDGTAGNQISITTVLAGALTATDAAVTGTNATAIKAATFTLSVDDNGKLTLEEDGYDGSTPKSGAVTFDAVKLEKDGLISPVLTVSVGVITSRTL
jgi:hypothetical protein